MIAGSYPDEAGHRGVATSMEAADALADQLARLQRIGLAAIREAGAVGLTAEELAQKVGCAREVVQPRTTELKHKHLIRDSGQRRRNASGKRAIVWVAEGREVAHG